MASSSSSFSVTSPCLYDVFLSFRREDIPDTFIARLNHALMEKGIFTFIYEDEVKRGDEISPELLYAIERSRISIIVLSANYASSTWCSDELLKILEWKKLRQRLLDLPVFYRVNPSDIRHQGKSFGEALTEHAQKLNEEAWTEHFKKLNVDMIQHQRWKAANLKKGRKCLISEFDGRLQMHDLLRDMGREVVRQESPENPGARSRLFIHKDVREVLEDDTGTNRVEAIVIDFPEDDEIIHLSPNAFKNMKSLRLFRWINASFSGELNYLPNSIRVLDWLNCPLQSMPSEFCGDNLCILQMVGSHIQEICFESRMLVVMNFRGSEFLTKISDISRCPNLRQMDFKDCKNLVEVHDSVASLANLVRLNLSGCSNLGRFPKELVLRKLQFLDPLDGSQVSSSGILRAKL